MFERYTEKARRVIFFARYEASQYGSPYIDAEHLLLGLLREDPALVKRFLGGVETKNTIRTEIEQHISPRERISTSVEMPLTEDCKKVLRVAAQEADRLAQRHVGTEHLLLGLLQVEGSLAAQILQASGLKLATLREELQAGSIPASDERASVQGQLDKLAVPRYYATARMGASVMLDSFLGGLRSLNSDELISMFAKNGIFIDALGKHWNREEISKNFEALFAPYAKKNAAYMIEDTLEDKNDLFVAVVLWKNAILASMERIWMHRMSVVLVPEGEDWAIALVQVTPVHAT
jgi:ClpA/ClpB-like protein